MLAPGLLSWQLLALADYKNANKVLDEARASTPGGVGYREPTAVLLVLRMPLGLSQAE